MIQIIVSKGVAVIDGHEYPVDTSYLEAEGVIYAEWENGSGVYEREPFAGRESEPAILSYVQAVASSAQTAYEQDYPPSPLTPEQALAQERESMIVSRFQARAALLGAGLLATADAAIQGADEVAKLAWSDAQEFRRNSPLVAAIAAQLGLTDTQLDDLFRQAATIEA